MVMWGSSPRLIGIVEVMELVIIGAKAAEGLGTVLLRNLAKRVDDEGEAAVLLIAIRKAMEI